MTSQRGLLRLEDKLAAEERRLELLGGPSLGHLLPLIVVAVLALHAVVLLLPTLKLHADLPAPSTPPDFPMVWRPGPSVPEVPETSGPSDAAPVAPNPPAPAGMPVASLPWAEPVPEPSPELAHAPVSADVEALIPPPDAVPPSVEPGGQNPATPTTTRSGSPVLLRRVAPVYPAAALQLHVTARVTVQLLVAADGRVEDASVLGSTRAGLGFEAAAIDAVKGWRYQPRDPAAGPRVVVVAIDFKAQEKPR